MKTHPELYDPVNPTYRNLQAKQTSWMGVALAFNQSHGLTWREKYGRECSVVDIQKGFNSLRTYYNSLKSAAKKTSGAATKSVWRFYDEMDSMLGRLNSYASAEERVSNLSEQYEGGSASRSKRSRHSEQSTERTEMLREQLDKFQVGRLINPRPLHSNTSTLGARQRQTGHQHPRAGRRRGAEGLRSANRFRPGREDPPAAAGEQAQASDSRIVSAMRGLTILC